MKIELICLPLLLENTVSQNTLPFFHLFLGCLNSKWTDWSSCHNNRRLKINRCQNSCGIQNVTEESCEGSPFFNKISFMF